MTVFIDPPAWPAHGTTWSHLISDTTLDELHSFASTLGIGRRAFDLDHYDVPARRYDDAVSAGAVSLGGRDLARRLLGSGLRVPGHARPVLKGLRRRWFDLLPDQQEIGDELLVRWREPHRVYHGPGHLADCLSAMDAIVSVTADPEVARTATLALWFHDAVHDGRTPGDEEASAALCYQTLEGVTGQGEAETIAELVLTTIDHRPRSGHAAAEVVSDADLAILASNRQRYQEYTGQIRAEYAHVPDEEFRQGRLTVLDQLLDLGADLYRTPYARDRWTGPAQANLRRERSRLL